MGKEGGGERRGGRRGEGWGGEGRGGRRKGLDNGMHFHSRIVTCCLRQH